MHKQSGFTLIELVFVVLLLSLASIVFFTQKNNLEITARDEQRKTAINAMYYGLEEIYHKQNQSYPRTLSKDTLPFVDPALFTDPNGVALGQTTATIDDENYPVTSDYSYEGLNCEADACQGYRLQTSLEQEDDYVRTNRTND